MTIQKLRRSSGHYSTVQWILQVEGENGCKAVVVQETEQKGLATGNKITLLNILLDLYRSAHTRACVRRQLFSYLGVLSTCVYARAVVWKLNYRKAETDRVESNFAPRQALGFCKAGDRKEWTSVFVSRRDRLFTLLNDLLGTTCSCSLYVSSATSNHL